MDLRTYESVATSLSPPCFSRPQYRDMYSLERAAAGGRDAFAVIVQRYSALVVGVAFAVTRDRELAEEVGQDTFVAAWRDIGKLRDPTRPGPWLAGIARNLANSATRKNARRRALGEAHISEHTETTPYDDLERARLHAELRQVLDELPNAQREALVIYYFEEGSIEDVARGLGVTNVVAKQRLHRARATTRDRLSTRHEGALAGMRPGAAFAIAVVAVIATTAVTDAAAATTSLATHATKGKLMFTTKLAAALLTIGGTTYAISSRTSPAPPAPLGHARASDYDRSGFTPVGPTHAIVHVAPSPEHRAKLAGAIDTARQRRLAAPTRPHLADTVDPAIERPTCTDDDCTSSYLQSIVEQALPLLKSCASERLAQDPAAEFSGDIRVSCTLATEPEVGAVITSSVIVDDHTTLADPQVRDCVRDTMYALEIDPAQIEGDLTFELAMTVSSEAMSSP